MQDKICVIKKKHTFVVQIQPISFNNGNMYNSYSSFNPTYIFYYE